MSDPNDLGLPYEADKIPEVSMEDALFFSETKVFIRPIQHYGQILCEVYATWPESQQSWIVAECFTVNPIVDEESQDE